MFYYRIAQYKSSPLCLVPLPSISLSLCFWFNAFRRMYIWLFLSTPSPMSSSNNNDVKIPKKNEANVVCSMLCHRSTHMQLPAHIKYKYEYMHTNGEKKIYVCHFCVYKTDSTNCYKLLHTPMSNSIILNRHQHNSKTEKSKTRKTHKFSPLRSAVLLSSPCIVSCSSHSLRSSGLVCTIEDIRVLYRWRKCM